MNTKIIYFILRYQTFLQRISADFTSLGKAADPGWSRKGIIPLANLLLTCQIWGNFNILTCFFVFIMILSLFSCGAEDEDNKMMYLSGALELETEEATTGPAFLMISRYTDDIDEMEENADDYMIMASAVDPSAGYSFNIDLSGTSLIPGERIMVVAILDNDYNNGIPYYTDGDYIGFYFLKDEMQAYYTLQNGFNGGINILVNRRVYDFEAEITGRIQGDYEGNVILVAFAGEMNSMSFDDFNLDDMVGFKKVVKSNNVPSMPFTMRVLPFGHNVPIENVFLVAMLDKNGNDKPDPGDMVGFYSDESNNEPTLLTIEEGVTTDKNIFLDPERLMTLPEPSGYDIPLRGSIELPAGMVYKNGSKPIYLAVLKTDDPLMLMDGLDDMGSAMKYLKHFEKMAPADNETNAINFNIDLSETDLKAGDKVALFALWDKDFAGGFPTFLTEGDYVGFYLDAIEFNPTYTLKNVVSDDINFKVNRKVYEFDAEVKGTVTVDGGYDGNILIIAFAGELNSMNFNDLDIDGIIGFKKLEPSKNGNANSIPFTLSILPFGRNVPIENVFLAVLLDKNKNDKPDPGDIIGFYSEEEDGLPTLITITDGTTTGKNIFIDPDAGMGFSEPSGYNIPLCGSLELPEGMIYDRDSKPIYMVVLETNDPTELLDNLDDIGNAMKYLKHFEKIEPPETGAHIIDYSLDLSETDVEAGDNVAIFALWDRDFVAGFPSFLTTGDFVGFYLNINEFSPTYSLRADANDNLDFKVSRSVYQFDAEIRGKITGSDEGDVTIIAYAGDINSLDLNNIEGMIDIDAVVGYQQIKKGATDVDYSLKILPFGKNIPIENVFLIAILDKNGNGAPDPGEKVGFHTDGASKLPALLTIYKGIFKNRDIQMIMDIPIPPDPNPNISISGSFEKPAGYDENSKPIFMIVAQGINIANLDFEELLKDPLKYFKSFYKMPPGENKFNIDLSSTDLMPGDPDNTEDDIFLLAVWAKNFKGGLPMPAEGDYIGFMLNEDEFSFSYNLKEGNNNVTADGYEIEINRKWYDHNSSVDFWFTSGPYDEDDFPQGGNIMVVALQAGGLKFNLNPIDMWKLEFVNVNMDYLSGIATIPIDENFAWGKDYKFNIKLLPAIYDGINVKRPFAVDDVFILAIHDRNSNIKPDVGEEIAFYWNKLSIIGNWDFKNENGLLKRSIRFSQIFEFIPIEF